MLILAAPGIGWGSEEEKDQKIHRQPFPEGARRGERRADSMLLLPGDARVRGWALSFFQLLTPGGLWGDDGRTVR